MSNIAELSPENPLIIYLEKHGQISLSELKEEIKQLPENLVTYSKISQETLNKMFNALVLRNANVAQESIAIAFESEHFETSVSRLNIALSSAFRAYHLLLKSLELSSSEDIKITADKMLEYITQGWESLQNDFYTNSLNREISSMAARVDELKTDKAKANRKLKIQERIEKIAKEYPINTENLVVIQ